jgi:hypothetical protein
VAKRPISIEQPEQSSNRIFGKLLSDLNKTNPNSFGLETELKQHYEGVAEGKNGEFADAVKPRTR